MKTNLNKQVRLDEDTFQRVAAMVRRSGVSESDVLRIALRAGLAQLESGKENPFSETLGKKKTAAAHGGESAPTSLPPKMRKGKGGGTADAA